MRGFAGLTKRDVNDILKQHSKPYDGYAVGNVESNMYPISVYDDTRDSKGITLSNNNVVSDYKNHRINEIAAKNLHYDEIEPAYDFDSPGPQQSMVQPNPGKKPYEFDSQGPSDPYYGGGYQEDGSNYEEDEDGHNFDRLLDIEDYLDKEESEIESVNESLIKTLDMFKRFKNFN
jgi:hypothetical protein